MNIRPVATALASAFLAGEASLPEILARADHALGRSWPWLRGTTRRYLRIFTGETLPRHRQVVTFLIHDKGLRYACTRYPDELRVQNWIAGPRPMQPAVWLHSTELPILDTRAMLASWLRLDHAELAWFADLKGLAAASQQQRLRHYHLLVRAKTFGAVRIIEAPKVRLKHLQQHILAGILDKIPAHPAAHGFLKRRSIRTFVTPHIGQHLVLRMDLKHYFPSIARSRVQALFRTIGFPESVADILGGLCTTSLPRSLWPALGIDLDAAQREDLRDLYRDPHLPQGAPTSPAIANLCCWRLDRRLSALAEAVGANYTRYADDLAFSGNHAFARQAERVSLRVAAIAQEEGFRVHHRKTRVMRQGVRQHLAGLTLNERMNVSRRDFDRLKATLTNCIRLGSDSQNREGHPEFRLHLAGRVGFIESIHPEKGRRLRALFDQIKWPSS